MIRRTVREITRARARAMIYIHSNRSCARGSTGCVATDHWLRLLSVCSSVIKSRLPYSERLISPSLLSPDVPTFSSGAKCKTSHAIDIRVVDKQSGK